MCKQLYEHFYYLFLFVVFNFPRKKLLLCRPIVPRFGLQVFECFRRRYFLRFTGCHIFTHKSCLENDITVRYFGEPSHQVHGFVNESCVRRPRSKAIGVQTRGSAVKTTGWQAGFENRGYHRDFKTTLRGSFDGQSSRRSQNGRRSKETLRQGLKLDEYGYYSHRELEALLISSRPKIEHIVTETYRSKPVFNNSRDGSRSKYSVSESPVTKASSVSFRPEIEPVVSEFFKNFVEHNNLRNTTPSKNKVPRKTVQKVSSVIPSKHDIEQVVAEFFTNFVEYNGSRNSASSKNTVSQKTVQKASSIIQI